MTVIHIEKFHTLGVERVVERVREVVVGGPIYVTIDVDGIDPAYTPGTGTPEVGGLTPLEVQRVVAWSGRVADRGRRRGRDCAAI